MEELGAITGGVFGTLTAIFLLIAIPGDIGFLGGMVVGFIFVISGGYIGGKIFSRWKSK